MLKSILKLEGVKELSKNDQKKIEGGGWRYLRSQGFVGGTICDYYEKRILGVKVAERKICHT